MTDKAQLIKQEIESYKESMKGLEPHSDFRRGQITAFNQIIQFIDSLPEEHNEDLEEEIEKKWTNWATWVLSVSGESSLLEESGHYELNLSKSDFKDIARHFAEWQKHQMMKEAINGIMDCDDDNEWIEITDKLIVTPSKAGKKNKIHCSRRGINHANKRRLNEIKQGKAL